MTIFRRFLAHELRKVTLEQRGDNKLPAISGTAAVYWDPNNRAGTQYPLYNDVVERIQPGAFDKAVGRDDVRALQNHDPRLLLGRSVAGTLSLTLARHGLDYTIDTPETSAGKDTVIALQRGDMTGSSFAFRVAAGGQNWAEEKTADGIMVYVRNVTDTELFDVGPVTYPAYSATSAGARSHRSLGIFDVESRAADAELTELRESLQQFIRENYYEPEARDRLIRMACLGV